MSPSSKGHSRAQYNFFGLHLYTYIIFFLFTSHLAWFFNVSTSCHFSAFATKNRPSIKEAMKIKIFDSSDSLCNDCIMFVDNTEHESLVNSSFFVVKLELVWFREQGANLVTKNSEKCADFVFVSPVIFSWKFFKGVLYRFSKNFINIFSFERQENLQLTKDT